MAQTPTTWDPSRYLAFADERLRSGFDLMARIGDLPDGAIIDLGCGTGEHAAALAARWPDRPVVGIDSSADMLAKAAEQGARVTWQQADARTWRPEAPVALLFSNSALQWLPDHGALFPHLAAQVAPGGVLAVQMPRNYDSPAHVLMRDVAGLPEFRDKAMPVMRQNPVAAPEFYYDLLVPLCDGEPDIWQAEYFNMLRGRSVVDWMRGTGLRPVLDVLSPREQDAFCEAYGERVARAYPIRASGTALFPQQRLFLVARIKG